MVNNNNIKLYGIAAVNNLGYLGKDGKLMWKSTEDFKHFKNLTFGHILIVGNKTFQNDFKGKSLPGRYCLVIGKKYFTSMQALTEAIRLKDSIDYIYKDGDIDDKIKENDIKIWIVGGESIYKIFESLIDEFHLSIINDNQTGDKYLDTSKYKNIITYKFEKNEE